MADLAKMTYAELASHHGARHPLVTDPDPFGGNYQSGVDKRENSTRGVVPDTHNTCVLCGRHVNPSNRPWFIYVVAGGSAFCHIEDIAALEEKPYMGSMGIYPIGPACKKRLPNGYASKDI